MQTPDESHWKATKRILQYVWNTVQFKIHCSSRETPLLVGFTDLDWAGDPDDKKSICMLCFQPWFRTSHWDVRNNMLFHFLQHK
jgi:hypothetical protein